VDESKSQVYEFDVYRLDPTKRLLSREDGELLPLTPKVFDTLLYLVRSHGVVIGKDELMREIWADTVVEENNLSQNISILRRTLGEKAGEGRFIATAPGRGFRFVPDVRLVGGADETPEDVSEAGEVAQSSVAAPRALPSAAESPRLGRFVLAAATIFVVAGIVLLGWYFWRGNRIAEAPAPITTIAVLPFKPLVAESRDEALEIGMADTLIGRLGSNRELIVRPLSSVRRFGGLEQDAAAAGRALDVAAVLDGSIQRWGADIRVNARLIRVADGAMLWTGTFDEKFEGIFNVQDAISSRVAAALSLQLGGDDKVRLTRHQTENVEAYQLYTRGRFHVYKLTAQDVEKGIGYFQQAIALDQRYALAYAGLADAYRSLALGSEMPPMEFLPKSKTAGLKAIELDDSLSEAHTALAMTIFWGDWDWAGAEKHFKRGVELDPNSANAHLFYSHLLSNLGRHTEALAEIKTARQLDSLFPFGGALEGQSLAYAGRLDEALDRLQKTTELEPNFWMPHLFTSGVYMQKGMYTEAVTEARMTRKLAPFQTASAAYEGYALARSGRADEARAVLDELVTLAGKRFVPPYHIALIYSGLGDRDNALAWLERGFEQRDPKMTFLKVDSKLDDLREDPRFISLMGRMNL
jgi:DNA-binding winged helix-turn-helix (wHTH) protein/TolB-like protein/Tfp pilus assembly protein PilF